MRRNFGEAIKAHDMLEPNKLKAILADIAMADIQQLYQIARETRCLSAGKGTGIIVNEPVTS